MLASTKYGWIGLDLGATSVKAAQVVRRDGGFRLRAATIVPRGERWNLGALADDQPRSSADELRAAASVCDRFSGSSAAALFPVAMCDVVSLDAPSAKRGGAVDVLKSVEAATDRPMRDRLYETWPAGGQGKINVVTAPRAWSDQIAADVARGGWNCQIIDALPFALARAASMVDADYREGLIAALDWGYGRATMCLVEKGAPTLVRTLKDCPYQGVLDVVSKSLRLEQRDAELLLQRHGVVGGKQGLMGRSPRVVLDMLAEPLARFADEIRRTIGYWQGLLRGKTPEAIYLFGGGGALRGVDGYLSEVLGMKLKSWDLPTEDVGASGQLPPACLLGAAAGLSAAAWEAL